MEIRVAVNDKRASVTGSPVIVCNNSGYTVKFTFDSEWDGLPTKTARFVFVQNGDIKFFDAVFTGDTVDVPKLSDTTELRVGAFAGELRTTTPARIPCERSIRCGTGAPADPTPSQYDQIMELLSQGLAENVAEAVVAYLNENPIDAPVTSVNGKRGDIDLTAKDVGALSEETLGGAIDTALAQAKESGEFDGPPGKDGQNGAPGKDGKTPVKGEDYFTEADKTELVNKVAEHTIEVVTPQMFGAVGDGVTDDTEAVQAALDAGGIIYFPAGRYKVTRQLTATKSGKISMFKPYPSTYGADYPRTTEDNWMGARIETYSPTNGIILGDGVNLDGFYIRAMAGFGASAVQSEYGGKGIVIQYDGSLGCKTYPATVRLSHIRVDIDARQNAASYATIPECLFDFKPNGTYHYIIEDVILGQHLCRMCDYAFRADIENTVAGWANNVFVRNLCIDTHCDYGVYLTGAATGWMFEGLTIQAYGYKNKATSAENHQDRVGHRALVKISNAQDIGFYSCYLWDTAGTIDYPAVYLDGGEIVVDGTAVSDEIINSTANISCVGCSPHFDVCETYIRKKLGDPNNLNIKNLKMVVSGDESTGGNILTLSDGKYEQKAVFPSVAISDEQIGNAVSNWMSENASPKEVVGRNKFNSELNGDYTVHGAYDDYNILGFLYNSGKPANPVYHDKNTGMWTTHFIPAVYGDVIRFSRNGVRIQGYHMVCYTSELEYIGFYQIYAGGSGQPETIDYKAPHVAYKDTAYIRICFDRNNAVGYPTDAENINLCITVNDTNISYEPYQITEEGGMANWLPLDEIFPKPGEENKGKLSYVDDTGNVAYLQLGDGLEIVDGRLCIIGTITPDKPDSDYTFLLDSTRQYLKTADDLYIVCGNV